MNTNLKKVHSSITNIIVYDLETFNKVRAVPYCSCIFKLSKISGDYYRNISEKDYEKCLNDCVVVKGSDYFLMKLGHILSLK